MAKKALTIEEIERRRAVRRAKRKSKEELEREKRLERRRRKRAAKRARDLKRPYRNRISEVWGCEEGKDAFVLGTGTSLTGFDFEKIQNRDNSFSIGLNDAIKSWPVKYSLFCDANIWARYKDLTLPEGTKMVCQPRAMKRFHEYADCKFTEQVWHFNHVGHAKGCNPDNEDLYVARTVATGGIMLAWKLGANRIFLLGVDGYKLKSNDPRLPGGIYYHDGSSKGIERSRTENTLEDGRVTQDRHEWWQRNMQEIRSYFDKRGLFQEEYPGSNIFNLSRLSTITVWQKINPEVVFLFQ